MRLVLSYRAKVGLSLLLSSLVSVGLYLAAVIVNDEWLFGWFVGNLALAWIPLAVSVVLIKVLNKRSWLSWQALALTLLWLLFLPNSFYIVTDYIHLFENQREVFMLDLVMLSSFALNGLILGYISLYMLHSELLKRLKPYAAALAVAAVLLIASYGIFMGRFLRRNSWDVVADAPSVLFEVSDSFINASMYQHLLPTTLGFFALLGSTYIVLWQLARKNKT